MKKTRWKVIHIAIFICSLSLLIGQFFAEELMNQFEIFILSGTLLLVILSIWESRQNREFRSLVERAPYGLVIARNKKIVFVNQKGKDLLGIKEVDSGIGTSLDEFITNDFKPSKRKLGQGLTFERILEGKLSHPDMKGLFVEVKFMPFVYKGKACEYIVIRDITELKKSEEIIQQSDKLSMVGELAAGIAHEIRNPLTSLRGFAQLVRDEGEQAVIASYSDIMKSEIDRINGIVDELLLLAKPKKLDLQKTKLLSVLEDVVFLLNTQAILHNIEIRTTYIDNQKEIFIRCEENKLKQVFINIIKNSIESMNNGGVIEVALQTKDQEIHIHIRDEGCGIPQEKLVQIGKAFFSTKEKGTGLGLMICQSIIQDHGGNLSFDSVEGEGTTVEIKLPHIYTVD